MTDPLLDSGFVWAVGIEDTFIPQVARRTGRTLDEYELTQHYRFWREDLERIHSIGVRHVRYGIPWYRVNPAPGVFDWSWTDEVLEHMISGLGIHPIIDLMHYGCPLWLDREFVNPEYPERVSEYAAAFVERYRALVRYYTPLNEPIVNAVFSGRNGLWPPYLRGRKGYLRMVMALVRGMSLTTAAIRAGQPDATIVHVEACERIATENEDLQPVVTARQLHGYLPTDLLTGRVVDGHPLLAGLLDEGVPAAQLEWLAANAQTIDVMGVNFYPMFSNYRVTGTPDAHQARRVYADASDMEAVVTNFAERYQVPVMVTETSDKGPVWRRERWMEAAVAGVASARERGVRVTGFTWFPVFSLVGWAYRGGRGSVNDYVFHMGLWDLNDTGDGTLRRDHTRLVDRYAAMVADSDRYVGPSGTVL